MTRRWSVFAALSLLVLWLAAFAQHEIQTFRGQKTDSLFGMDFRVYYLAGVVSRMPTDPPLYYPVVRPDPSAPGRTIVENPQQKAAPENSEWRRIDDRLGLNARMLFLYPPFFAVAVEPFTHLSPSLAWAVWRELGMALLFVGVWAALRTVRPHTRPVELILLFIAATLFFPLDNAQQLGQVAPLMFALYAAGTLAVQRGRTITSGVLFALATLVKLTPALVVPLFIARRQWRWLFAYTATIVALTLTSIARLGWDTHKVFVTQVMPSIGCGYPRQTNASLATVFYYAVLGRVGDASNAANDLIPGAACGAYKGLALLVVCVTLAGILWWRGRSVSLAQGCAALAAISLAISPVSWRHNYVLLLLPLILLWMGYRESAPRQAWVLPVLLVCTVGVGTAIAGFAAALHPTVPVIFAAELVYPFCALATAALLIVAPPDAGTTLSQPG